MTVYCVEVLDENGKVVGGWNDDEESNCYGYYGYCGGCPRCLEMQANHAGLWIRRFRIRWWHRVWWAIRYRFESWIRGTCWR